MHRCTDFRDSVFGQVVGGFEYMIFMRNIINIGYTIILVRSINICCKVGFYIASNESAQYRFFYLVEPFQKLKLISDLCTYNYDKT